MSQLPTIDRQEYNITAYTENQVGLLNRIAIIFSRRKINIESLNTSPSEIEGIHRFNIVITETEEVVSKLARQIEKQVDAFDFRRRHVQAVDVDFAARKNDGNPVEEADVVFGVSRDVVFLAFH